MLLEILNKLNKPKSYLLLANAFLVLFLIILSNIGILPIKNTGDFIFFAIIFLAFALYRPSWAFLFFIGTIALENINLAPEGIGIAVRPYQFVGGLTILAVLIKLIFRRLGFNFPKWSRYDLLFIIFTLAGFLSVLGSVDKILSLKQSIIVTSFAVLYFLVRIFIQSFDDLKKIIPFFLSSSIIVVLYGIWQNIRFSKGLSHFETMPGRPNATFVEADWLGIYLVLLLATIYVFVYWIKNNNQETITKQLSITNFQFSKSLYFVSCILYLAVTYILLILTVSRSAWLGALAISIMYQVVCIKYFIFDKKDWKGFFKQLMILIFAGIISLTVIYIFNLTNFRLFNRVQSTGTGLQKITISCSKNISLPEKIETIAELTSYSCRHINLEEVQSEQANGNFVKEIYRNDPNVSIRSEIYKKSWNEIKQHPILGIGWGNIGKILGSDDRGASLNSSNIFLEIWLGTGIIGTLAFLVILAYILVFNIRLFISGNIDNETLGLFGILGLIGLIIPNLFNAGIMLGFVWIFFAISTLNEDRN